ncbi:MULTISPECIES: alcohol dehydrogenase [Kocuria]|uniref:alcohol dehydrogenase n=1 Tax=Kocuria TaxID=57493 RepID=UPI000BF09F18|nr:MULTISPECIES: alcohol dehydrogenase [unclassified Kocuria]QIR68904.1 alcohol dehydrogenase catalytic domain-containing protein [Kocuria sp. KD4]
MKVFAHTEPGGAAQELEVERPELEGSAVMIRVTNSGVCHSDVHCQDGYFDLGNAGRYELTAAGAQYPVVLGHEIVGEVVAAGPDATVTPGDTKYIVFPWIGCGECQACSEDRENYCSGKKRNLSVQRRGGYAEEVHVPDERYLVPLGDIDPSFGATLACSGLTSYSAVKKIMPLPADKPVAVIGAGGVGLMTVAVLKALGHENIVAVDMSEAALKNAQAVGASATVAVGGEDLVGDIVRAGGEKIAAAIDLVNNGDTSNAALFAMANGGTLVSVGLFGGQYQFPTALTAFNLLNIRGNFVGSLPELKELVKLAQDTDLPKPPITELPLTAQEVNSALDGLRNRTFNGRAVLVAG